MTDRRAEDLALLRFLRSRPDGAKRWQIEGAFHQTHEDTRDMAGRTVARCKRRGLVHFHRGSWHLTSVGLAIVSLADEGLEWRGLP